MKKVQWTFDSEAENINLNNSCLGSDIWNNLDNFIFLIIGRNLIWTLAHFRCARPIGTISSVESVVLYRNYSDPPIKVRSQVPKGRSFLLTGYAVPGMCLPALSQPDGMRTYEYS